MGEVERIRASLGATFGQDLGPRINAAGDRQPKKHQEERDDPSKGDAIELHVEPTDETKTPVIQLPFEPSDHLDLSA